MIDFPSSENKTKTKENNLPPTQSSQIDNLPLLRQQNRVKLRHFPHWDDPNIDRVIKAYDTSVML